MPAQWSHAAGLGAIGSCLEHAAASTHIWRPAWATPGLIWRGRAGRCVHQRARLVSPPQPAPPAACITSPTSPLLPFGPSFISPPFARLLIALRQPGTRVIPPATAIKGVMQRAPSHSRTQRGAHCTVLSRCRRPSGPASPRPGRASPVLVHRPYRQAARPRPDPAGPPDPGRPEWRPEASAGSRVSERGEGGSLSFPLRPLVTSPAPPRDPRREPSASEESGLNFPQPPLLPGASESFSPRTHFLF